MIIVDGFNVYPSDVESVLYAHPAVRLAAVIGVPDAYHGEIVKACVALKPGASATADDDRSRTAATGCAEYKVPRVVEIRDDAADERGRQDPLPRAARRARRGGEVMTHVEARRTMSGLEFFRKMLAGEMPPPPMIDAARHPARRGRGRARRLHRDRARSASTTASASRTAGSRRRCSTRRSAARSTRRCRPGRRFTTLELKVNLTRPLTQGRRPAALRSARSSTSAGAPPPPKAASSIATASSTPTARRRASSSTRRAGRWNRELRTENSRSSTWLISFATK